VLLSFLGLLVASVVAVAVFVALLAIDMDRISPDAERGFHWPYVVFASRSTQRRARRGDLVPVLVLPNKSGGTDDNFQVHARSAFGTLLFGRIFFSEQDAILLVPVFPRWSSTWELYTHALDRDTLLTEVPDLRRLDRQLVEMIDDAIGRFEARGWRINHRVAMWGFSASGMFVNRFVALHPDRVAVAAISAPGGWPLAPARMWEGRRLRYPVGTDDLAEITGVDFKADAFRSVPQIFFLGSRDTNDSVPFDDGYDDQDEALIFALFGDGPVARWPAAEQIYRSTGCDDAFRLYPGVGHNPAAFIKEANRFIRDHLAADGSGS
jgi:pimeloyl-ACP methyl ester carboxylesterase